MSRTHLPAIDLNLFVVLDAIYTEGGVTRASQRLNLTQPAISHALARLREVFDDPLFVRQGRAMVPTPLVRNVIEPVRRSLRLLDATLGDARHFDPASTQKRFVVGLRGLVEATALPLLVSRVGESAPQIDIASVRVGRNELETLLASGKVDAVIDVSFPVSSEVRHQPIAMDRLVVLAREAHPSVRGSLDLAAYLRGSHVLVSSRRRGTGAEDIALAKLGLPPRRVRLRCQSYFAACRVIGETDLLLTMPERYARLLNRETRHQILPMPIDAPPLAIHLYWHAAVDGDAANRWLRAQLLAAFGA